MFKEKDIVKDSNRLIKLNYGLGGTPEGPKEVFVLPVEQLKTHLKNDRNLDYLWKKKYSINLIRMYSIKM